MEKMIQKAQEILAAQHNINVNQLDYIGAADMSWKAAGAVQFNFNINCVGHANHKSTVAVNSWNM
jgi:hypothetical protein